MTRAKNLQKLLKKVQSGIFDRKFDPTLDQMFQYQKPDLYQQFPESPGS
jgi:hypothetical protein